MVNNTPDILGFSATNEGAKGLEAGFMVPTFVGFEPGNTWNTSNITSPVAVTTTRSPVPSSSSWHAREAYPWDGPLMIQIFQCFKNNFITPTSINSIPKYCIGNSCNSANTWRCRYRHTYLPILFRGNIIKSSFSYGLKFTAQMRSISTKKGH